MRVVGVVEFGGPEVLRVLEAPDPPSPRADEVKIRVHAASVNPTDTHFRSGTFASVLADRPPPFVPGMEAAGVVTELGDAVDGLMVGDAVMAIVLQTRPEGGAYAEQVVVPAASVARAPRGASHAEAATLPMNGLTARLSLDELALTPGQTIAVTGAAGAYGGYVVQLAKAEGLRVIADASAADEQLVRDLGADVVVRRGDDVAARIRDVVPEGVDALADGAIQNDQVLGAVKDGGAVAAVRGFAGSPERGIDIKQIRVSNYATAADKLDQLGRLAEAGAVTLRVARTFAPEEAAGAHRLLERGGVRGRAVIVF